jgi:hypothetical protein
LISAEVGYLVGGEPRLLGVLALLRDSRGRSDQREKREKRGKPDPRGPSDEPAAPGVLDPESRLEELGLLLTRAQRSTVRLWGAALFGGLLATGLARVWVGVSRDRPVGLLLILIVVVAYFLFRAVCDRVTRTSAGRLLVDSLQREYLHRAGDTSYAMGFALLGWTALANSPELQAYMRSEGHFPPQGGGSSCIGCAGIGGCGGGGGGGGGGCGGCVGL